MEITIMPDKSEYYPGDILKGKVKLLPESKTSIKDIEISFYLIEDWNHLRSDKKYETSNNTQCVSLFYVRINLVFAKPDNTLIDLEPKEYIFSFEEKLPDYLLPSFEFPQNKFRAFVRYSLTAKVVPDAHVSNSTFINILAVPQKEDIKSLSMGTSLNVKKTGLFNKGETNFKVIYPTKNYKINDKVPIDIEIDNINSKMKVTECKLKLMRKITFRDKEDFCDKYFQEEKLIRKLFTVNVNKKEKKSYNFILDLSEISFKDFNYDGFTDPYKGTKNIKDLIPSIDGNILSCEYTITVMLKFDSHVKKEERPKIVFPIYIVQKLDNDHIIKAQDEIERLKINEEEEKNNNNIINEQNIINNNFNNEKENDDDDNNNNDNGYNPYNNIDLDFKGNNNIIIKEEEKENNYIENNQNIQNDNDEDDDIDLPSRETLVELYKDNENNNIINNYDNNININNNSNGYINNNNYNNNNNLNNNKYNENININNYDNFNNNPKDKINLGNNFNGNNNINNANNIGDNNNNLEDFPSWEDINNSDQKNNNNNNLFINNKNVQNMGNNINSNNNDKNDDEDNKETDINLFDDDDDDDDDDNKKNDEQNKNKMIDINSID
jgi:hypothetical protein